MAIARSAFATPCTETPDRGWPPSRPQASGLAASATANADSTATHAAGRIAARNITGIRP